MIFSLKMDARGSHKKRHQRPLPRHGRGGGVDVECRAQQRPRRGQGSPGGRPGESAWDLLALGWGSQENPWQNWKITGKSKENP